MRKYHSDNNKIITSNFEIGDVVKVKDYGNVYAFYAAAFQHFGIPKRYVKKENGVFKLNYSTQEQLDMKYDNWVIIDIAIHGIYDDIILFYIKNIKRDIVLIIDKFGIEKNTKIPKQITKNLRKCNENKIIKTVKNSIKYEF